MFVSEIEKLDLLKDQKSHASLGFDCVAVGWLVQDWVGAKIASWGQSFKKDQRVVWFLNIELETSWDEEGDSEALLTLPEDLCSIFKI